MASCSDRVNGRSTSNYIHNSCLICNSRFMLSKSTLAGMKAEMMKLNRLFIQICNIPKNTKDDLICLHDCEESLPFCTKCSKNLSQIRSIQDRLEKIQEELEELIRSSIQKPVLETLSTTSTRYQFYSLKELASNYFMNKWSQIENGVTGLSESHVVKEPSTKSSLPIPKLPTSNPALFETEVVIHSDPLDIPADLQLVQSTEEFSDSEAQEDAVEISGNSDVEDCEDANANLSSRGAGLFNSGKLGDCDLQTPSSQVNEIVQNAKSNKSTATTKASSKGIKSAKSNQRTLFVCDVPDCLRSFKWRRTLVKHVKTHQGNVDFKCEVGECKAAYNSMEALRKHARLHDVGLADEKYVCKFCPNGRYHLFNSLKYHIRRNHKKMVRAPKANPIEIEAAGNKFKCVKCSKIYPTFKQMKRHIYSKHQNQPHRTKNRICHICGKSYSNSISYYAHMNSHKETAEDGTASSRKPGPVQCDLCGKVIASQGTLRIHKIHVHNETRRLICEICGRVSSHPSNHKRHMETHAAYNERSVYQCKECPASFTKAWSLRKHERSYHPDLPPIEHVKPVSGIDDALQSSLKHMTLKCSQCSLDKVFATPWSLKAHVQKFHLMKRIIEPPSGKPYYACQYCSNTYLTSISGVTQHMRLMHPDKPKLTPDSINLKYRPRAKRSKRKVAESSYETSESETDRTGVVRQMNRRSITRKRSKINRTNSGSGGKLIFRGVSVSNCKDIERMNFECSLVLERLAFVPFEVIKAEPTNDDFVEAVPVITGYASLADH